MRILITGGAGFIGGHLAEEFVKEGHYVVAIDNFDPYYDVGIKKRNIQLAREAATMSDGDYDLVRGDVRDEELIKDTMSDVDIVYHQAAQAGVRTSIKDPKKPNSVNTGGILTVLETAREEGVERVVAASSSSVYGKPKYLPYDENHPTNPVSPYGVSKLAAEHYSRVFAELYGLETLSVRYFTVYGPRMRPNMAITNFVSRCLNGDPPVIYGDGSQTRDFTYIDDVVEANRAMLTADLPSGEVLNVGSTDNINIQSLAELIRDELAPEVELVYDESRAGDAEHTHADVSKARDLIGYDPEVDIRQGVRRFIKWYQKNRDWYEQLVLSS